ncbi:MAG: autoinducer binding domain-containing protein [Proteobacteria bacterium]|nr:autoinducer binding domain-containing protein [Pseudomonadota bacterium]
MNGEDFLETKSKHLAKVCVGLSKLGITYFSYGLICQKKVIISRFSNEEWEKHYKDKGYNKKDPLLLGVIHSNLPLIVWDALHPIGHEKKVMQERNEICKIRSGITFGINGDKGKQIIAFGSPASPKEFYYLLQEEKLTLEIHNSIKSFYMAEQQAISHKA